MADKNKTEEKQEVIKGQRGEVGTATASLSLKQRWHEQCHLLVNVGDKHNPHKQAWQKKSGMPSLKKFARQLAASGDQLAIDWFAVKNGALNTERTDTNKARIELEKAATSTSRKRKASKSKSTTTTDATPVKSFGSRAR